MLNITLIKESVIFFFFFWSNFIVKPNIENHYKCFKKIEFELGIRKFKNCSRERPTRTIKEKGNAGNRYGKSFKKLTLNIFLIVFLSAFSILDSL
jgi:hypothetical protein